MIWKPNKLALLFKVLLCRVALNHLGYRQVPWAKSQARAASTAHCASLIRGEDTHAVLLTGVRLNLRVGPSCTCKRTMQFLGARWAGGGSSSSSSSRTSSRTSVDMTALNNRKPSLDHSKQRTYFHPL